MRRLLLRGLPGIAVFLALIAAAPFSLAQHELICQDEINPDAYENCIQRHHETASQQVLEHEVREQLDALKIKVIIPTATTLQETLGIAPEKIYYYVQASSPTHYQVSFDQTPLCHGHDRCIIGSLYASKIERKLPENQYLAYASKSNKTHDRVTLSKKLTGFFEKKQSSKTSSSFRTLIWNMRGSQYQLTLTQKDKQAFVSLANHLIENGY